MHLFHSVFLRIRHYIYTGIQLVELHMFHGLHMGLKHKQCSLGTQVIHLIYIQVLRMPRIIQFKKGREEDSKKGAQIRGILVLVKLRLKQNFNILHRNHLKR